MLTRQNWEDFEQVRGWQEVVETVKERMRLITRDLLNPDTCNSEATRVRFQTEYMTCLWFINLPKMDVIKEEEMKDAKDRTFNPDLDPFRKL